MNEVRCLGLIVLVLLLVFAATCIGVDLRSDSTP